MKSTAISFALIFAMAVIGVYFAMFYDIGKTVKAQEFLDQCRKSRIVRIGGTEIRCSVVSVENSIRAAKYRRVKNCAIDLKRWQNEKTK